MTGDRMLVIRMGGTIDAEPYPDSRHPPKDITPLRGEHSLVIRTAQGLGSIDGLTLPAGGEERFVKDSKYVTDDDIRAVAAIIRKDSHRYVIVTHGTDAMAKNAAVMKQLLAGNDKVVAFTGAVVPLSMDGQGGIRSDGRPALEYTIRNITRQSAGVSVVGVEKGTRAYAFLAPETVDKNRQESLEYLQFILDKSGNS